MILLHYVRRAIFYIKNRPIVIAQFIWNYLVYITPDRLFLKVKFRLHLGYWMDFDNPKTFNEKLQWLKINDKHPEYTSMVDKICAKEYVSSVIGDKYIIPTLGVWNSVEDIDWDSLPNQFVIKPTNDSGSAIVCKNKTCFDIVSAKRTLKTFGARNYAMYNKEYPYRNVPHRFIAEQYMEDESGTELKDYKFFCFNGEVKFLFVATGRQHNDTRFDFFDTDFNHLPVINGHPNADICPIKPDNFNEMIDVASQLSSGIPHVRVDLYNINGKVYFGELTFFHWSGIVPFEPTDWDSIFGSYLVLPD